MLTFGKSLCLLLVILAVQCLEAQEQKQTVYQGEKKNLHVYLLIGQSNMAGRGLIGKEDEKFPEGVFLLNEKNIFEPATHPLNQYSTIGKEIGKQKLNIGYRFAKIMRKAQADVSIGLVVNARGGSGIEHWVKGSDYYNEAVKRVKAAQQQGTLKGILWHQGERNSGSPTGYDEKLAQLIKDFRKDFNDPSLPFVAGQIVDYPNTKTINALIAELPEKVSNTGYVSSKGLKTLDRWHFDGPAIIKLGEGYAKEMLRLEAELDR